MYKIGDILNVKDPHDNQENAEVIGISMLRDYIVLIITGVVWECCTLLIKESTVKNLNLDAKYIGQRCLIVNPCWVKLIKKSKTFCTICK